MAISSSSMADNIAEEIQKIKCKDCDCFLWIWKCQGKLNEIKMSILQKRLFKQACWRIKSDSRTHLTFVIITSINLFCC